MNFLAKSFEYLDEKFWSIAYGDVLHKDSTFCWLNPVKVNGSSCCISTIPSYFSKMCMDFLKNYI